MTTKVLTGTYTSGYLLQSPITTLSIAASGYVEGTGITTPSTATVSYTVVNDGRIVVGAGQNAIDLQAGGSVTNGSATDTTAKVQGLVQMINGPGVVSNFGTILGNTFGLGTVYLHGGGSVTNGSAADRTAEILGWRGINIGGTSGTVTNFGSIIGTSGSGMFFSGGGVVTNGSTKDPTALIHGGSYGVNIGGTSGTVKNFGTIESGFVGYVGVAGVHLGAGGSVTNGGTVDTGALIFGYYGVVLSGAATVTNLGVIQGTGPADGAGVYAYAGSSVTNGAANDTGATIEGFYGVTVGGGATAAVTNFGTISGAGGTAVLFGSSTDVLVVEAGSAFVGQVLGDGGTLDLASGVGTFTLAQAGGNLNVTVSGSMAATTFTNFATVEVGPSASFTLAGAEAIAADQILIDAGSLTVSGTVNETGRVTVGGPTSKAATFTIAAGATWDIQNNGGIALGLSTASSLKNQGTLIKSAGTARSVIAVQITNGGSIVAASGTLDFTNALTGAGGMSVLGGATLEADSTVAAALRMNFNGSNATLALRDPAAFSATIRGFAPTDTIDLLRTQATSAMLGAGDTLVITNGATTVATLRLAGTYTGDTFNVASDGIGGTNITVSTGATVAPPPAASVTAVGPVLPFVTAMAGIGSGAPVHVTVGVVAEAWRPVLIAPRMQIA